MIVGIRLFFLQRGLLQNGKFFYYSSIGINMIKQSQEQKVYSDVKLKLKYEILNKIGEGCFGMIFRANNRVTKRQVALKIQFNQSDEEGQIKRSNIANEISFLEKLKGVNGIPKLYGAGKWAYGVYMEIQLLSSSLQDEKNKQYSQAQIYVMASELIQVLKQIHERKIIHQDLKPQNIMRNAQGNLVIIDFGLSTFILPQSHQMNSKKRGFIGTPRYASLAAHNGCAQKPKDDIESLLYVLGTIYMKKAPWFQLKGPACNRLEKIQKYKQINSLSWFKQCGCSFFTAFTYLNQLGPKQDVDYVYLNNIFTNARKSNALKTQKFQSLNIQSNRRKSDADAGFMKIPTINIHLVGDKNQKQGQIKILTYNKDDHEQISRSHNNFSQMAQDGYLQLLQFLTQKIFSTFEDHEDEIQDCALVSSICCREPEINNLSKYQALHFKNPFET